MVRFRVRGVGRGRGLGLELGFVSRPPDIYGG